MPETTRYLITLGIYLGCTLANSSEIVYKWKPAPGERAKAEITKFKYGKRCSYSVEHDDGGSYAYTTTEPLCSSFFFTDAPPKLAGKGKKLPLVGSVAINCITINSKNTANLSWKQIKELLAKGRGVTNHSYWHTGCHWDKNKMNSPEQFRREIFWGQAMIGYFAFNNETSTSCFAYPNGDHNYSKYLEEYDVNHPALFMNKLTNTPKGTYKFPSKSNNRRIGLDEGKWKKNPEPMHRFPTEKTLPGMIISDFTHKVSKDRNSDNYKRWQERLKKITSLYGATGKDLLWSTPVSEVMDYIIARDKATLQQDNGQIRVSIPDDINGSALTLKITGVHKESEFPVPQNGSLYRDGNTVWVTLPKFGRKGPAVPEKAIKLIHEGKVQETIKLDTPHKIAGIRLLGYGKPAKFPKATLVCEDGSKKEISYGDMPKFVKLNSRWGAWFLIPVLPIEKPVKAREIRIEADKCFKKIQIWAVD